MLSHSTFSVAVVAPLPPQNAARNTHTAETHKHTGTHKHTQAHARKHSRTRTTPSGAPPQQYRFRHAARNSNSVNRDECAPPAHTHTHTHINMVCVRAHKLHAVLTHARHIYSHVSLACAARVARNPTSGATTTTSGHEGRVVRTTRGIPFGWN